jgi:hypothetical protein
MDLSLDPTVTFGGAVTAELDGKVRVLPNLWSYAVNYLVPERHLGRPFRPYPRLGYEVRKEFYRLHPAMGEFDKLMQGLALKHMGATVDQIMARLPLEMPMSELGGNYSMATVRALIDPSRLEWATDVDEVARALRDKAFQVLPSEEARALYSAAYRDPIAATLVQSDGEEGV